MSTVLNDFLNEHGITPEQVVAASKALEKRSTEDRELVVKRATAKREKKSYEEAGLAKPQAYGRGVGKDTFKKAIDGRPLPRITRKKIVRAVNDVLAGKKKDPVESRQLFSDVHIKGYKPKAED